MKRKIRLFALLFASVALTFSSCSKEEENLNSKQSGTPDFSEKGANPDDADLESGALARNGNRGGYLYTESNESGTNHILIYEQHSDGSLSLDGLTASGGSGSGDGLGSQGALMLDANHHYLFAVNAGDNTVSSFEVNNDGSLTLAYTAGTSGIRPISVTCYNDLLYVLNTGSDSISGFRIGEGGSLTMISGSVRSLSGTGVVAPQISFSPNGSYLYVTEKATNLITEFHVNANGVAGMGSSTASTGVTPFGFEFGRNDYMIVSNAVGGAAGAGSATSYKGANVGNLDDVNGAVANNQAAPCWVAVTKHGRYAFTTNTASDNISSYYIAPNGGLYLVHEAIPSGDAPIDMVMSGNNFYSYVLCASDNTIQEYKRTLLGGLNHIGSIPNLPDFAAGLAAW